MFLDQAKTTKKIVLKFECTKCKVWECRLSRVASCNTCFALFLGLGWFCQCRRHWQLLCDQCFDYVSQCNAWPKAVPFICGNQNLLDRPSTSLHAHSSEVWKLLEWNSIFEELIIRFLYIVTDCFGVPMSLLASTVYVAWCGLTCFHENKLVYSFVLLVQGSWCVKNPQKPKRNISSRRFRKLRCFTKTPWQLFFLLVLCFFGFLMFSRGFFVCFGFSEVFCRF